MGKGEYGIELVGEFWDVVERSRDIASTGVVGACVPLLRRGM